MNAKESKTRKFAYRTPRYAVDLPVCFKVQDSLIPGRCREIGDGGMRLKLDQDVPPGTCGTLSIRFGDIAVDVSARVTHSESGLGGLKFQVESIADREAVAHLIAYFSDSRRQNRPMLVR